MSELPKVINMILERQHSKGKHKIIGNALAIEIKNGGFDISKENKLRFCKELECSENVYYYVRKLLEETGLIKREKGKLIIDLEFSEKFIREWNGFMYT
jgi:hypothetical protein